MKSDVDHLRKQFYHESKRLEKEISRLKDKVHQVSYVMFCCVYISLNVLWRIKQAWKFDFIAGTILHSQQTISVGTILFGRMIFYDNLKYLYILVNKKYWLYLKMTLFKCIVVCIQHHWCNFLWLIYITKKMKYTYIKFLYYFTRTIQLY